VLLPQPRRELREIGGQVLADTMEDVDEIVVRVDVVQPTGAIRLWTTPTC